MNTATAIVIPANLPAAPFTLVDQTFMAALAVAELKAARLKISDQASAQDAAALQAELTKAGVALEKERVALLRPFLDAQNAINAAAKTASSRIALTKGAVNAQLVSWDTAQKKLAEEAEKLRQAQIEREAAERQAEINRLEKLRREELAEAERKAAELLKAQQAAAASAPPPSAAMISLDDDAPAPVEEIDDAPPPAEVSDTERQLVSLRHTPYSAPPLVPAPKVSGIAFRSTLKIASINVAGLPDSFVTRIANEKLLRDTYITGWKEGSPLPACPGVVFQISTTPVSR